MKSEKEIIFVTQTGATGWVLDGDKAKELEKRIADLTGKEVVVLGPGMHVEILPLPSKD